MKKVLCLFSILVLAITINTIKAQNQVNVDLVVFEPLPEIEVGSILVADGLKGAQRIFQITFNPIPENDIILYVQLDWKKSIDDGYELLYNFTSKPFKARTLTNADIGTTEIKQQNEYTDTDLLEELVKKGKPTGALKVYIEARDESGPTLGSDVEELSFINPAQTLSIRSPEAGSTQDIGAVLAEWDDINGVSSYSIRANVRKNTNQSFEEALKSGNPLINDKDVGMVSSVNLRELLDREWLPGQEIVFQVTANISGPGGGSELYSDIVNFKFPMATSSEAQQMNQTLVDLFQNLGDAESARILSLLQNGDINLEDVTISFDDGQVMTLPEFQNLMNYLGSNPDAVINITYNKK